MCKLLIMTSISDPAKALEFMHRMAIPMSRVNDDGIGYTAVNANGDIFSQRWLKNHQFLDTTKVMTKTIASQMKKFEERLPAKALEVNYSSYGKVNFTDVKTITLHTRYATCGKEFANTHPFIHQDTSLIHNGGISNYNTLAVNKISTCDSEAALQTYLTRNVAKDMDNAQEWLDTLEGRWAFGILAKDETDTRILDVVRGYSMLYYMEIEGIGRVFTTDKDDAESVAKDMKLGFLVKAELIPANSMYRYNATNGDFIKVLDLEDSIKNYKAPTKSTSEIYYGASGKLVNGKWVSYKDIPPVTTDEVSNAGNGYDVTDPASAMSYPDVMNNSGTGYDFRKVNKYCNDSDDNEPLIDRLAVWDDCYSTNLMAMYESLNAEDKAQCEKVDFMNGFQVARTTLFRLSKAIKKA